MNYKLINSLAATLLFGATFGSADGSSAEPFSPEGLGSETPARMEAQPTAVPNSSFNREGRPLNPSQSLPNSSSDTSLDSITKIQSHDRSGRSAATLYLRNIPVLTFISPASTQSSTSQKNRAEVPASDHQISQLKANANSPATEKAPKLTQIGLQPSEDQISTPQPAQVPPTDPTARAAAIATKLDQMHREGMDAKTITVRWQPQKASRAGQYVIEGKLAATKVMIVAMNSETVPPQASSDPDKDALQVTNRLRRLLGNAPPIQKIRNQPDRASTRVASSSVRAIENGMASWYGPGFHGNTSASGEIFNQNAMTAAHKYLPFGTRVQVTNMDNGRSTVVRINDRGPYAGGRVIDLSAEAARVLGVMQSGVAPVRLDILR